MCNLVLSGLLVLCSTIYISGADQKQSYYYVNCFDEKNDLRFSHQLDANRDFHDSEIIDVAKKCFPEMRNYDALRYVITINRTWTSKQLEQESKGKDKDVTWQKEQICLGNCTINLLIQYKPLYVQCCEANFEGSMLQYQINLNSSEIGNVSQIQAIIKQVRQSRLQQYMIDNKTSDNYTDMNKRIGDCQVEVFGVQINNLKRVPVGLINEQMIRSKTHELLAVITRKMDKLVFE